MADWAVVVTRSEKLLPGTTGFGETAQVDSVGTPPQERATNWSNPPSPTTLNVYFAVCPGETVADDE
jgi:hypothetical protein